MKKMKLLLLCLMAGVIGAKAQIGYQISLLNTATGEPRANETVTVSVSLSNNANEVFYTETKSATTNDFGVLSLSIGNADTFNNVDLSKMPFFIEVTANGVMIGKSQMLSVPVAEVAKRLGSTVDMNLLYGHWQGIDYNGNNEKSIYLTFYENGTAEGNTQLGYSASYHYYVEGNLIYLCADSYYMYPIFFVLRLYNGYLLQVGSKYRYVKQ